MNKRIAALAAAALLAVSLGACTGHGTSSANKQETKQQQTASKQLVQNQPIPQFNYSQLRQNLIEVETAEAQGVQTTSFFFNLGAHDPIQSCPSIGAPIATTAQLSNPDQLARTGGQYSVSGVISQMEPTGTYTGDSSGTYVMCIGGDGQPYANYWEGFVQTVFAPAEWDAATHSVKITGPASFKFTRKR